MKNIKALGIIPARYNSKRFPGKPLVDIGGKSMIERVYEQASKSKSLSRVLVATDDERIASHVRQFGEVVITSDKHTSGTDRCAEVAQNFKEDYDVILNIQGDEPFIQPKQIDLLVSVFNHTRTQIATLAKAITDSKDLFNPNVPKVVINKLKEAIYFSRATIPHFRGLNENEWIEKNLYLKHIGIYAFLTKVLLEVTKLEPSPLEIAESLEQLRWLENGYHINVEITDIESCSIDTPEDLKKIKKQV